MGMFECPVHGLTFIQLCCEHIAAAIDARKAEHTNLSIDNAQNGVMLCDVCAPKTLGQTVSASEWSVVNIETVCGDHAEEWYSKTGQGDLLASFSKLRATPGE